MSAENSPGRADRGQLLLIVLVALALIASLIMLFTDSAGALKLALLAALWAAIIGFFLVTQYRRRAERTQERMAHQEELHRIELDRLEAVRRHQEAGKEVELRDAQLARDTEVLEDIKRELAALRAQLEELNGREFGYEPAALRAEARRIQELEARTSAARSSASRTSTPGSTTPGSTAHSSFSDLGGLEDMGELADLDDDSTASGPGTRAGDGGGDGAEAPRRHVPGAPSPDAVVGRLGQYEPTRPQVNPLAHLISESYHDARQEEAPGRDRAKDPRSIFDTGAFQNVPWDQGGAEEARPQAATPEAEQEPESEPSSEETRTVSTGSGDEDARDTTEAEKAGEADRSDKTDKPEKADQAEAAEKPEKPEDTGKGTAEDEGAPEVSEDEPTGDAAQETAETSETDATEETEKAEAAGDVGETPSTATTVVTPTVPSEDGAPEPRRGRRRRDEHTDGISVAELLANLKKDR